MSFCADFQRQAVGCDVLDNAVVRSLLNVRGVERSNFRIVAIIFRRSSQWTSACCHCSHQRAKLNANAVAHFSRKYLLLRTFIPRLRYSRRKLRFDDDSSERSIFLSFDDAVQPVSSIKSYEMENLTVFDTRMRLRLTDQLTDNTFISTGICRIRITWQLFVPFLAFRATDERENNVDADIS